MHALQQMEQLPTTLTRVEKAHVLQWVFGNFGEAFPGIESTPDVCGGSVSSVPYASSYYPRQQRMERLTHLPGV